MSSKKLISILGPTASGKTAVSIAVAKHFDTEIISCDSRQFYSELSIGTAKPSSNELANVRHHFIGHLSINDTYSAGQFERDALDTLSNIFRQKTCAVLTGGSGLYSRALFEGIDDLPSDEVVREKYSVQFQEEGLEPLLELLQSKDPEYFEKVDRHNHVRLIRALEVIEISGSKFSDLHNDTPAERPFGMVKIGIDWDREVLYDRINRRVDEMIKDGLVDEARSLEQHKHKQALQTVGYKELFEHFKGKTSLDQAIELIKRNTRRYAKRQLTWLRKEADVQWFKLEDQDSIIAYLESKVDA